MEITKDYNPDIHFLKVKNLILNNLGNPVYPSNAETFKRWRAMSNNKPPRTFMFVIDLKQNRALYTSGMSLLGFPEEREFSSEDLLDLLHENQKRFLSYQTFRLYEMFFSHPKLFRARGATYCNSRAIRDVHDNYWLTHQASTPFQFDENGIMIRYLSAYRLLGEYKGQAIETEIYTDPEFPREQEELRKLINDVKRSMLQGLGFNISQRKVLDLMSINLNTEEIADEMARAKRTVERYRYEIIQKAKQVFPVNNFQTCQDVVLYLKNQNII
jgi:DNA-binding CsgD family transcriptional regulator